jgi:2-dehydro-3-deoxygluconokinase
MPQLSLRHESECAFDVVSLGEVMLRLDPGDRRIHTTRSFDVWEGGGEYNVARGLRRCFEKRAAILTSLVDNPVGRLVEDLILQGGVDTSLIHWVGDDGAGRAARNGLNFVERGFGMRAPVGCSDRGHTAISQLQAEDLDLQNLFGRGVRWLHTGGIYAALSETAAETAQTVMAFAKASGTKLSYDLNYRPSLWKSLGGKPAAQKVNQSLVNMVDVLFGNEEDFSSALGFEVEGVDEGLRVLPMDSFKAMIERVLERYPHLTTVATTLRSVHSVNRNSWGALCYHEGEFYEEAPRDIEVFDRVGGGDSFASGFIYGLLEGKGAAFSLKCGVCHGALAMTTPGDTTMATRAEVMALMNDKGARISR